MCSVHIIIYYWDIYYLLKLLTVDEEHQKDLEVEIKRADVLVMIYSVESVDSIAHIHDIWLPKAQRLLGDRSKVALIFLFSSLYTFLSSSRSLFTIYYLFDMI